MILLKKPSTADNAVPKVGQNQLAEQKQCKNRIGQVMVGQSIFIRGSNF